MREILIYGPIGNYWGDDDVRPTRVLKDIADAGEEEILVRINSPGGDCFDGMSIYSALAAIRDRVIVRVEGLAASIASVIALAGRSVEMTDLSFFMVHKSSTFAFGTAEELMKQVNLLQQLDGTIAKVYADRAGGTVEEWIAKMEAETWLSADDALTTKLADVVIKTNGKADAAIRGRYAAMARTLYGSFQKPAATERKMKMSASPRAAEGVIGTCTLSSGETSQTDETFCTAAGGTWAAPSSEGGGADDQQTAKAIQTPKAATISEIETAAPSAPADMKIKWLREGKTADEVRAENMKRLEAENAELRRKNAEVAAASATSAVRAVAVADSGDVAPDDEQLKSEWDSDPKVRAEFRKFATFAAFRRNKHRVTFASKVPVES